MRRGQKKLLKLSLVEEKIISRLEKPPYTFTVSALAHEIKTPRRTVGFNLLSLLKRGLLKIENNNQYPSWSLKKIPDGTINTLVTYSGIETIQGKLWSLLQSPNLTRYYTIQGTKSIDTQLKLYDYNFTKSIHDFIKKKKLIIEGIISESGLRKMEALTKEQLFSHKDRLTIVYVLNDEVLDFKHDFYIIGKTLCIIDYHKQLLTLSEDPEISAGILSLFKIASTFGRKIILNDYIDILIKKSNF